MLTIGLICLLLGWLLGISILVWVGALLLVVGAILMLAGSAGRTVGGRRHWY